MIGYESTLGQANLNTMLGSAAVNLRNACEAVLQLWSVVNSLGVTGLEGLGFTDTDAQAFFSAANYMQTVAGIYYGTGTQATAFNFDNALAAVRAGQ